MYLISEFLIERLLYYGLEFKDYLRAGRIDCFFFLYFFVFFFPFFPFTTISFPLAFPFSYFSFSYLPFSYCFLLTRFSFLLLFLFSLFPSSCFSFLPSLRPSISLQYSSPEIQQNCFLLSF